jgi:dihydrofolate reductase
LSWKNSHLLGTDVPGDGEKLREHPGGEIRVWGSSDLIRTLADYDLVDAYRLCVYPLILGQGKKFFPGGSAARTLSLVESRALRSGVVVNT